MKFQPCKHRGDQGNILVTTLFLTALIGFVLTSYLMLVSNINYTSMRSQSWNSAISVIEAGIEEALTHLNVNTTNLASEGWSYDGDKYFRSRTLGDSRYEVTISAGPNPEIISRGYVPLPEHYYFNFFAAAGLETQPEMVRRTVRTTTARDGLFVKGLVARLTIDMNGNNVMTDSFDSTDYRYSNFGQYDFLKRRDNGDVASNTNIINSVNIGNANIYGRVSTGPRRDGVEPIALGPNGAVGSLPWQNAGNKGIQPGYFKDDMNVSFPVVHPPFDGGYLTPGPVNNLVWTNYSVDGLMQTTVTYPTDNPPTGITTNTIAKTTSTYPDPVPPGGVTTNTITSSTRSKTEPAPGTYVGQVVQQGSWYYYKQITGYTYSYIDVTYTYGYASTNYTVFTNNYAYLLADGNYQLASLNMASGNEMLVTGDAVLYVTGNVKLSGNAKIIIAPGGKLKLYVAGASADIQGNGVFNYAGNALNFMYYGLPSNTSLDIGGNGEFIGVIYAPDTALRLHGGGNSVVVDFTGAAVGKTITLNGHYKFHYDEALARWGPGGNYVITSWNEVGNDAL